MEYNQFRTGHHLNLFVQVMGLLELLQPYIFNEEHKTALEDTLENYFQCFQVCFIIIIKKIFDLIIMYKN